MNNETEKIEAVEMPAQPVEVSPLKRTIGVEIECLVPNSQYDSAMRAIASANGTVTGDGSIDGQGEGVEVKLGPLTGDEAEKTIKRITKALNSHEASVNATTGLHVHVDATELSIQKNVRRVRNDGTSTIERGETIVYMLNGMLSGNNSELVEVIDAIETTSQVSVLGVYGQGIAVDHYGVRQLTMNSDGYYIIPTSLSGSYRTYAVKLRQVHDMRLKLFNVLRFMSAIDPVLRGLVPSSRRHNTYCHPLEKMARLGGVCPNTFREVLQGIGDRYCGINLKALERHGTIECRYHQGTTNADKIIHWARLFEGCVRFAMSQHASRYADELHEIVSGDSRLEALCALLNLPESTCEHLKKRFSDYKGSDARHTIAYIKNLKTAHARGLITV